MKNSKIFYGWYIVIVLFLTWTFTDGVFVASFTTYIEPITNKFGWTYTQVSFGASLRSMTMGILTPVIGLLSDRWSIRKLVFTGIILGGLSLFLLGRISALSHFYLCFFLIGASISACTAAVPMTMVGRWFRKRASLVTGIVVAGAGTAGLLVPLVTWAIDVFGWQTAMAMIGLCFFIILTPLSLIIRQSPEQYGLLPYGDVNENSVLNEGQAPIQISEINIGVKQSLKSSVFWRISVAFALHALVGAAVMTHIMPYLSTVGIARFTSSYVASALTLVSIFGRIGLGWLGDKFDKRRVAAFGTILVGLGLLFLSCVTSLATWGLLPAVILIGIGWGGTITLHPVLLRDYFGISNLGSIIGFSICMVSIGLMAGPPLNSWIFESFGSYRISWFILIGVAVFSVISQLTYPSIKTLSRRADSDIVNV